MAVRDLRDVFPGGDASDIMRRATKEMMQRATHNGLVRERQAELFQYTSKPALDVQVVQVQHNPPLWRMRTLQPLVEGGQCIEVLEPDPTHLEAEMRAAAVDELVSAQYFSGMPMAEQRVRAREWVSRMVVKKDGTVLLLDSERTAFERRR